MRAGIGALSDKDIRGGFGKVTVSIGVIFSESVNVDRKLDLVRIADEALYEAKKNGKNKVVLRTFTK